MKIIFFSILFIFIQSIQTEKIIITENDENEKINFHSEESIVKALNKKTQDRVILLTFSKNYEYYIFEHLSQKYSKLNFEVFFLNNPDKNQEEKQALMFVVKNKGKFIKEFDNKEFSYENADRFIENYFPLSYQFRVRKQHQGLLLSKNLKNIKESKAFLKNCQKSQCVIFFGKSNSQEFKSYLDNIVYFKDNNVEFAHSFNFQIQSTLNISNSVFYISKNIFKKYEDFSVNKLYEFLNQQIQSQKSKKIIKNRQIDQKNFYQIYSIEDLHYLENHDGLYVIFVGNKFSLKTDIYKKAVEKLNFQKIKFTYSFSEDIKRLFDLDNDKEQIFVGKQNEINTFSDEVWTEEKVLEFLQKQINKN